MEQKSFEKLVKDKTLPFIVTTKRKKSEFYTPLLKPVYLTYFFCLRTKLNIIPLNNAQI